jgi:glutathione S-transferase
MGTIPALQVNAELVLTESAVIIEWLDDSFVEMPLMGATPDARADARFIQQFHDLHLEPQIRALFKHVGPTLRDRITMAEKAAAFMFRLRQLEGVCKCNGTDNAEPYFLGGTFSTRAFQLAADCVLPATLQLAEKMLAAMLPPADLFEGLPQLHKWRARISTHPAVAPVLVDAAKSMGGWIAKKLASTWQRLSASVPARNKQQQQERQLMAWPIALFWRACGEARRILALALALVRPAGGGASCQYQG